MEISIDAENIFDVDRAHGEIVIRGIRSDTRNFLNKHFNGKRVRVTLKVIGDKT